MLNQKEVDDRIKVLYEGKMIGAVLSNYSMTAEEVIEYALGLTNLNDQDELKELYDKGVECVYINDDNEYAVDFENMEIQY